jgi:hypothetical protein
MENSKKYFTRQKKFIIFQKSSTKEPPKNPSRYLLQLYYNY